MHTGFLAVPALFSALCWQKKRLQNQWERWSAGRGEAATARPKYNPSPAPGCWEQQDAKKGFGGLGKGCQRVTWQEADQIQWSPAALPFVCTSDSIKNFHCLLSHSAGMTWTSPQKSAFGESCLRSQSWLLGKWLLYFKRVAERKEQPQSKPLRNILQIERPSMGDSKTRPLAWEL